MKIPAKLFLIVLGGIFIVLGVMLVIALFLGDRTTEDEQNNNLDTNSAGVVELVLAL